jgi:hypothetical protein
MQPPRTRAPRIELGNTETLRMIFINGTAVIITLLLIRAATLLVSDSSDGVIPGIVQMVTEPIVWIFKFIPILGDRLIGDLTLIDLLMIPIIAFVGLLITGIMTGWRESGSRTNSHPSLRDE